MAEKENPPVEKWRFGNIIAAVWRNESAKGRVWYNVSITRQYCDGEEWKDASTFSGEELLVVSKAADMAYTWIWERMKSARQKQEVEA